MHLIFQNYWCKLTEIITKHENIIFFIFFQEKQRRKEALLGNTYHTYDIEFGYDMLVKGHAYLKQTINFDFLNLSRLNRLHLLSHTQKVSHCYRKTSFFSDFSENWRWGIQKFLVQIKCVCTFLANVSVWPELFLFINNRIMKYVTLLLFGNSVTVTVWHPIDLVYNYSIQYLSTCALC